MRQMQSRHSMPTRISQLSQFHTSHPPACPKPYVSTAFLCDYSTRSCGHSDLTAHEANAEQALHANSNLTTLTISHISPASMSETIRLHSFPLRLLDPRLDPSPTSNSPHTTHPRPLAPISSAHQPGVCGEPHGPAPRLVVAPPPALARAPDATSAPPAAPKPDDS